MSVGVSLNRFPGGLAKPAAAVEPEASDWDVLGALTFTSLALSDVSCAADAEELVAAIREAFGDSVVLKIATVAAATASGKMDALALERHMATVFTPDEMQLPMVELIRATLLFVEKDSVCRVDKTKYVAAKESLEKLAETAPDSIRSRAKQVLGRA